MLERSPCSEDSILTIFFFLAAIMNFISSKNGTPVETADEGALIATVTKSKKRRTGSTGDSGAGASLDINLGDGQYISLQDPMNMSSLDAEKKIMALQQLQLLKSQVDSVLKHLQN